MPVYTGTSHKQNLRNFVNVTLIKNENIRNKPSLKKEFTMKVASLLKTTKTK